MVGKEPIPSDARWAVWERDDFRCKKCGTRQRLSIDHIWPESQGGLLVLENLQTLCVSCNSQKGAKRPTELTMNENGKHPSNNARTWQAHGLAPGFWVALTIREGSAPSPAVYVGVVQAVDRYGVRLTLIDWVVGRADSWDLFVPWSDIRGTLVATPDHFIEEFGKAASDWQRAMKEQVSDGAER